MKARKLPSGRWNVQVLDYIDESGKKHTRSFTADTKAQAEYEAAKFKSERTEGGQDGSVADIFYAIFWHEIVIRRKGAGDRSFIFYAIFWHEIVITRRQSRLRGHRQFRP